MILTLEDLLQTINLKNEFKLLPVCHTAKQYESIISFIKKGILPRDYCKVFKEDLLYFFYGQAQYIDDKIALDDYSDICPIIFIYDFEELNISIKRLFPFDSGGFNLYEIHSLKRESFEILPPKKESIRQYIDFFYGSNEFYLNNLMNEISEEYDLCKPLQSLMVLSREIQARRARYGWRAVTFEIQSYDELLGRPIALILPDKMVLKKDGSPSDLVIDIKQQYPSILIESYNSGVNTIRKYNDSMDIANKLIRSKFINA